MKTDYFVEIQRPKNGTWMRCDEPEPSIVEAMKAVEELVTVFHGRKFQIIKRTTSFSEEVVE